jgi:hypothetical protein
MYILFFALIAVDTKYTKGHDIDNFAKELTKSQTAPFFNVDKNKKTNLA